MLKIVRRRYKLNTHTERVDSVLDHCCTATRPCSWEEDSQVNCSQSEETKWLTGLRWSASSQSPIVKSFHAGYQILSKAWIWMAVVSFGSSFSFGAWEHVFLCSLEADLIHGGWLNMLLCCFPRAELACTCYCFIQFIMYSSLQFKEQCSNMTTYRAQPSHACTIASQYPSMLNINRNPDIVHGS